ncbi:hypothetical protein CONPUDRAFT_30363, partial [Coniophora puteana RWD-64-598 SS2]
VDGLYHRNIVDIALAAIQDPTTFSALNTTPFEQRYGTSDGRDIRIYSEAYNSDAALRAYREVSAVPRQARDTMERIVILVDFYSDGTLLANFGEASLHPIYMFFANQSKYTRSKPTSKSCHHLAYIPDLPSGWQNTYTDRFKKPPTKDVHTHMRRELMQAVWRLLLSDKRLRRAYDKGLVSICGDGLTRRAFIRFNTYAGDFLEKQFPCPRCLIPKDQLADLGTPRDMRMRSKFREDSEHRQGLVEQARNRIFKKGYSVNSTRVKSLLEEGSFTPTTNAFSEFLLPRGVNFFSLFAVDLLHEFELGVWKTVFTHLIRIL